MQPLSLMNQLCLRMQGLLAAQEQLGHKKVALERPIKTRWIGFASPMARLWQEFEAVLLHTQSEVLSADSNAETKRACRAVLDALTDLATYLSLTATLPFMRVMQQLIKQLQSKDLFIADLARAVEDAGAKLSSRYTKATAWQGEAFAEWVAEIHPGTSGRLCYHKTQGVRAIHLRNKLGQRTLMTLACPDDDVGADMPARLPVGKQEFKALVASAHPQLPVVSHAIRVLWSSAHGRSLHAADTRWCAGVQQEVTCMAKGCQKELRKRFPTGMLLRAFSVYDARYWRSAECTLEDFRSKLEVLCAHYSASEQGGISLDAKKLMQESGAAFAVLRPMAKNALQQQADSAAAAHIKTVDELSKSDLDSCSSDNDTEAAAGGADLALAEAGGLGEGKGLHANTIMWRRMEQLPAAATLYGETMRVAKLGMTMVATSVMDERAFSAMSFIKNRLRARLTKSLQLCMRAKLQQHFNVDTFPYGSVF
jgi:hypothetical protein